MRQAYELGYVTASIFAGEERKLRYLTRAIIQPLWDSKPENACTSTYRFISIDDISFVKPVEIGKVLSLSANVAYTASDEGEPPLRDLYHAAM